MQNKVARHMKLLLKYKRGIVADTNITSLSCSYTWRPLSLNIAHGHEPRSGR